MTHLTNRQARQFLLLKHGLADEHKFAGKQGAFDFIRQAGCIQFDPIDVCGKNPELVLQSRVKGFTKQALYDLMYTDRLLVDDYDKQLSIYPVEDWPYFARHRKSDWIFRHCTAEVEAVCTAIKETIREKGAVSSADLEHTDTVDWHWGVTAKISSAALDTMFFRGEPEAGDDALGPGGFQKQNGSMATWP